MEDLNIIAHQNVLERLEALGFRTSTPHLFFWEVFVKGSRLSYMIKILEAVRLWTFFGEYEALDFRTPEICWKKLKI